MVSEAYAGREAAPGFTLIEMLIVLALIGILTGLVGAVFVKLRHKSIQIECSENLHSINTAINAVMLANSGVYPPYLADSEGNLRESGWVAADDLPWWARVFRECQGAEGVDLTDLPGQLPSSMKMFHCRMAPALQNPKPADGNLEGVHNSVSYGLNFDVKDADGSPYECSNDAYPFFSSSPAGDDKKPDTLRYGEIKVPGEFILVSEAYTEKSRGGRIACTETHPDADADHAGKAEFPIVARHGGKANVLYADGHVGVMDADTPAVLAQKVDGDHPYTPHWRRNINRNTPHWTLPDD